MQKWIALACVALAAGLACERATLRGIDFGPEHDPFRKEGHVDPDELKTKPVYRLVLVGDGGAPQPEDPTLALLGQWGDAHPGQTSVVYLGDNIYPAGLQGGPDARARGEGILMRQLQATKAHKIFIPGNHDWGNTTFQRITRGALENQQQFIESHAELGATFEPKHGCPGPVAMELLRPTRRLAGGLTVIALDLDWWLLPEKARPVCEGIAGTDAFITRLREELEARRAQNVVVVAHHPIRSGGPHGGFTRGFWIDYGLSVFYRFYSVQDLLEPTYRQMVKVLGEVLEETPVLAMVGGHDHSLQLIEGGKAARLVAVSGASSETSGVTAIEGTLFAHAHRGFLVFDLHETRQSRDGVLVVNVIETGAGKKPVFSLALDLAREKAPAQRVPARTVRAPSGVVGRGAPDSR